LLAAGRAEGYTVRDLAEQLSTSKRNVERDLAALTRAGFPLKTEQDPAHRQRLRWVLAAPLPDLPAPTFGSAELLSLYAATSMLEFLRGTPVHMDLLSVLEKVRGALPEGKGVSRMAGVFTPHLRSHVGYDAEDSRAILDDLMDATARHLRCQVTYQAAESQRAKSYVIRPLRLFGHHNALYAFVQIEPREAIRTLAVHRIRALEVLKEPFDVPHQDLDTFAQQAFGVFIEDPEEVEIVFDKSLARYAMERSFHPSERKVRLPDGRVRYTVRAGGRNEMVAFVLGFGGAATLTAPAAWRQDLAARARALQESHDDTKPRRTAQKAP
jgi:predicted DNA-binding transcriptional regulator YafY